VSLATLGEYFFTSIPYKTAPDDDLPSTTEGREQKREGLWLRRTYEQ